MTKNTLQTFKELTQKNVFNWKSNRNNSVVVKVLCKGTFLFSFNVTNLTPYIKNLLFYETDITFDIMVRTTF